MVASVYNAGRALCCEYRSIRWLPEPHVNLTGFHGLKQCLRWWRFHSNRLSVVRESFLGWLWFAAQSGVSENSLSPLCLWNPRCAIMSINLPLSHVFRVPLSPHVRHLHCLFSACMFLLFSSSHPLCLCSTLPFLLFESLSSGIKLMPAAVNLS